MTSVRVIRRGTQARRANRAYANRTRQGWVATWIVFACGVVDDRPMMARNRLRAGNVWGRTRDAGVHLGIGWIGTGEACGCVQASVINSDADIVLRSAIVIDLAQDAR